MVYDPDEETKYPDLWVIIIKRSYQSKSLFTYMDFDFDFFYSDFTRVCT